MAAKALTCGTLLGAALCLLAAVIPAAAQQGPAVGPVVIAHRGASGYLPEHTLPAYTLAIGMGADFVEPDLVLSRDGELLALHDVHLEATTDVEQRFPERARSDGRWYAVDFTAEEIATLTVHERTDERGKQVFATRFSAELPSLRVPAFREVLETVAELNRLTGCRVGVYPELKEPAFHAREGLDIERALLETLEESGWDRSHVPLIVQSFEPASLLRLRQRAGSELELVQLISAEESQDGLVSPQGLERVARYADGIGPSKERLRGSEGRELVDRAHSLGLRVHPWTYRADAVGDGFDSFEAEVEHAASGLGVDGFFTDHPDRLRAALPESSRSPVPCPR